MASFRSLTADGQPLEDFRKAVPKANGIQTPPQTPSLHVHLFEWSQSSQDGTESSGLKSIEELESQNTSTVRVL
jgi:lysozyme family protein